MRKFINPGPGPRLAVLAATLVLLAGNRHASAQQPAPGTQASAAAQPGLPPRRLATRDAISEQALKQQVAAAATMDSQMKTKALPLKNVRASMQNSFLTNSLILCDGQMYTVVPVGSILNLPPTHRNKVVRQPQGEFTFWPDFLQRNSAWLAAKEVPLRMAKGDAKAGEAIMRAVSTQSKVIVSVYKGGPITILEASPEAAAAQEAASKAVPTGAN